MYYPDHIEAVSKVIDACDECCQFFDFCYSFLDKHGDENGGERIDRAKIDLLWNMFAAFLSENPSAQLNDDDVYEWGLSLTEDNGSTISRILLNQTPRFEFTAQDISKYLSMGIFDLVPSEALLFLAEEKERAIGDLLLSIREHMEIIRSGPQEIANEPVKTEAEFYWGHPRRLLDYLKAEATTGPLGRTNLFYVHEIETLFLQGLRVRMVTKTIPSNDGEVIWDEDRQLYPGDDGYEDCVEPEWKFEYFEISGEHGVYEDFGDDPPRWALGVLQWFKELTEERLRDLGIINGDR